MLRLSSFTTFLPRFLNQTYRSVMTCSQHQGTKSLLSFNINPSSMAATIKPNNEWSLDLVRTNIRNHFPHPRETKRVKCHGYKKRMSTRSGRAVLMRRILKGRHVLSH